MKKTEKNMEIARIIWIFFAVTSEKDSDARRDRLSPTNSEISDNKV